MTKLVNRAKMTTATTGTGTITLGAAESGYQTFADAGVVDTDVVRYVIEDGNNWEIGTGTYTASGTTLSRTVSESSNADAALNLTGSAVVYVSAAAADILSLELYAENPSSPTAPSATGTNAVAIGDQSVSVGTRSIALGDSYASGADSLAAAITNNTSSYGATGANSVAIGKLAKATASGAMAFGDRNVASGEEAVVFGENNTGSGPWSFTVGRSNTNSGSRGIALGNSHTVSGFYTFASGSQNTASEGYCTAIGSNSLADRKGKLAHGSLGFGASFAGSAQYGRMVLAKATTDATPVALTSIASGTADTTNQVILPNNSAYSFSGTIIARQQASAGSEYASWEIKGALLRDGTAATTVLGNGIKNKLYASAGASAWDVSLTADTTNGGLAITVTGAAATNIRWVATVNTSEVTY